MTPTIIDGLLEIKAQAEGLVQEELSKLPNWTKECHCGGDKETYDIIYYGEWKEIHTFCLKCGGVVD